MNRPDYLPDHLTDQQADEVELWQQEAIVTE